MEKTVVLGRNDAASAWLYWDAEELMAEPESVGQRGNGRIYARASPRGILSRSLEDIWIQEAPLEHEPASATVLAPGPSSELVICYGDPFERLDNGPPIELPPVHVVGPRTRPMHVRATGRTGLVIVRLHPWMVGALIQESPGVLVDEHLDFAAAARPSELAALTGRIGEARGARAKIDIVASWLEGILDGRTADPLTEAAVRGINDSAGGARVAGLARGLCLSERQLRRRFRARVGLGPKRFSRLVRFQKALGLLRAGRSWDQVLDQCAFFDQAHLIRELVATAGLTPRRVQGRGTTPLGRSFNSGDIRKLHGTTYI